MEFRIEADITGALRDLEKLEGSVKHRVLGRALNRTITGVRTDVSSGIRKRLNVKASDVRKVISVRRARAAELSAEIVIAGKGAPLAVFGARQTKKGVTIKVLRGGARKTIRGAFIATMKSGHKGVFVRRGKRQLPIDERFGEAPAQSVLTSTIMNTVTTRARERFERELAHEMSRVLPTRGS